MPRLIKTQKTDSTNEWIKRNLNKLNDLDSVIAEEQTAAKGKNKKDWFSPKGGLWLSIILRRFTEKPEDIFFLCTVAVCETIQEYDLPVKIKWPNDIFLKGKKLGGILIEKVKDNFILGIGLNLNLSVSDFPIPLKDTVITTKDTLQKDLGIETIAKEIIKRVAQGKRNPGRIYKKYTQLNRDINKGVKISAGEESFTGKVIEIQPDGGIKIANENTEKVFYSGSLHYLK